MIQQCCLLQGAYTKISLKHEELNSLQQTYIRCNLSSAGFDLNYVMCIYVYYVYVCMYVCIFLKIYFIKHAPLLGVILHAVIILCTIEVF